MKKIVIAAALIVAAAVSVVAMSSGAEKAYACDSHPCD